MNHQVLQKRVMALMDSYSLHRDDKSTDDRTSEKGCNSLRSAFMDPLEVQIFEKSNKASEELDSWLRY